jgi:D-sedoheptulose 7-phosphate isomerase
MEQRIREIIARHRLVSGCVEELLPSIVRVAELLIRTLSAGNKVLVMGNGGSAADAQHLAAELVGRFVLERRGLPAVALTTDSSILTAIGNDYGFEAVFARQVEALAVAGDLVIGISTSGNSVNVRSAMARAREFSCATVGLLGRDGGALAAEVDIPLTMPLEETARVQEGHILIIHILCQLVEEGMFAAHNEEGQ